MCCGFPRLCCHDYMSSHTKTYVMHFHVCDFVTETGYRICSYLLLKLRNYHCAWLRRYRKCHVLLVMRGHWGCLATAYKSLLSPSNVLSPKILTFPHSSKGQLNNGMISESSQKNYEADACSCPLSGLLSDNLGTLYSSTKMAQKKPCASSEDSKPPFHAVLCSLGRDVSVACSTCSADYVTPVRLLK